VQMHSTENIANGFKSGFFLREGQGSANLCKKAGSKGQDCLPTDE
jgi:hypothetical protein